MAARNGGNGRRQNGGSPGAVTGAMQPQGIDDSEYGWSQIGVHDLVPKLGYREYWYPAIEAHKVGKKSLMLFGRRKPSRVKMLGEDIVIFEGMDGNFGALWDRCPHRGTVLSYGRCEFKGTISCPYHGYTFDETGLCVAALTEGPDSGLNGKLRAKSYPTAVVRGVIFVWMGQTEPVPIEEDVPEEFFNEEYAVKVYSKMWPLNWTLTIENSGDSHNSYIHRFRLRRLFNKDAFRQLPAYWSGTRVVGETDKSIGIMPTVHTPQQAYYPLLGSKWPQRVWWRFLKILRRGENTYTGKPYTNEYRLPSIARVDTRARLHNRWAVPIDEDHCNMFTFGIMPGGNRWKRLLANLYFHIVYRYWLIKGVNELEDLPVQRFDRLDTAAPQKLGTNDRAIIFWRRKMPLKSRDAQRVWGNAERAAVEAAAAQEYEENFQPEPQQTVAVGDDG